MTRVLVVEDDAHIARALVVNLRARGYATTHAGTGAAALRHAADDHPELILLDLGLPDMSGLDVIAGVRGWSTVPIVVVSARGESQAKVAALDAGADDYVTKPFAMDELLARFRAALRRAGAGADAAESAVVRTADGALTIDIGRHRVLRDGEPVRLTPTELRIVEYLARNRERLVAQRELLQEVWGPEYAEERHYARVYLSQIRTKLEPDPSRPRYFLTELGMGYRFVG